MAKRLCKCGCGESLEGLDKRRQFLNDTHRKQVGRGIAPGAKSEQLTGPVSTEIADRYRQEFSDLGVLNTGEAQIVLGMCVQLDAGDIRGSAYVSLSKEVDRRVDALRLRGDRPDSKVSQLRESVVEKQSHLRAV